MSGYVSCGCPDCFEIAITSNDESELALCSDCEEAGCDGEGECQSPHAYGGDEFDSAEHEERMREQEEAQREDRAYAIRKGKL